MKRRNWILGSAALVLVGSLTFWLMTSRASSPRMERYLPERTIAFVETANLSNQLLQLVETRAWKEFSQAYPDLATGFLLGSNYSGLLKADVALALTGIEEATPQPEPTVVLLAESNDGAFNASLKSFLETNVGQRPGLNETVESYKGQPVHSMKRGDETVVAYATLGGLHIFSNGGAGIRQLIDVKLGQVRALTDNSRLAAMRDRIGNTDGLFGFVDGETAREFATRMILTHHPEREGANPSLILEKLGLSSVAALGFSSSFESQGVTERLHLAFSGETKGLLAAALASPGVGVNHSLEFIPADARHVFTASLGDLVGGYNQFKSAVTLLDHQRELDRIESRMLERGVHLPEDLGSALGHEATFARMGSGEAERERMLAVFEAQDTPRLADLIRRMAEAERWSAERSDYRGVTLQQFSSSPGTPVLAVASADHYSVWSTDPAVLRSAIDAKLDKNGILTTGRFRGAFTNMPANALFRYYSTNDRLIPSLAWSLGHKPDWSNHAEPQSSSLLPTAVHGVVEPGGLYVESYSPIGSFPRLLVAVVSHLERR